MAANMMELARSLAGQLSAWRRDLHRWPELGFCEMLTSCRIARTLTDLGFDQVLVGRDVCFGPGRMGLPSEEVLEEAYAQAAERGADPVFLAEMEGGFTGVVGILRCGEGPTVALRFDIDALPIQESRDPERLPVREGFVSEHPGVMHACGHDGHTAVGLGVAQVLAACREQLHGTVKLLFQPAEEGVRGAKSMVENGHLDGVDYVLGAHVGACQPGEGPFVGVGSGGTLAMAKFDAVFTGKSSHAGMAPQEGRYAMLAAATAVLNLFAIPRHGDAPTRINVGKLTAGTGRNIVCDRAVLELEVRGSTSEANAYMADYARQILEAAAAMHGCEVEIACVGAAERAENTPALRSLVLETLAQAGVPAREIDDGPEVSEDFSYFAKAVTDHGGQSCYFMNLAQAGAIHHPSFDFDEAALVQGVQAFCAVTARLLEAPQGASCGTAD